MTGDGRFRGHPDGRGGMRRTAAGTAGTAGTARTARNKGAALLAAAAAGALLLTGCGGKDAPATSSGPRTQTPRPHAAPAADTRTLPGVGPKLSAKVPASARQALVVYGASPTTSKSTVTLFTRSGGVWHHGPSWPSHNAIHGWTLQHHEGDLKSPIGVFTLHDAGGLLADPGSHLPYHRSTAFTTPAYWPKSYHHDFDYVIAIDYNRVIGRSPSDPTRPQGESRGGGIWIHLDHGVGTSACVTVSKDAMRYLLGTLQPSAHPVVVMGDTADLAS
jgi:L,D-peptidoglycan transpeptidase YkuD (ErfK/YbiS/YcfS/YnhG family)